VPVVQHAQVDSVLAEVIGLAEEFLTTISSSSNEFGLGFLPKYHFQTDLKQSWSEDIFAHQI